MIPARINLVTLGVTSVAASRAFYEALGWRASSASQEGIAFFQLGALVLALFERAALAADAGVLDSAAGFPGVTLAQNLASPAAVDAAYAAAIAGGGTPLKAPQPTFWGGYHAYFGDPDGFPWELAHNPFFPLDPSGAVTLPE